jgi:hypothetical protein
MAEEAGILRSAAQSRVQLYIPYETAHDTVKALGEVGLFQPEDLSEDAACMPVERGLRRLTTGTLVLYLIYSSSPTRSRRPRHDTIQQDLYRAAEDTGRARETPQIPDRGNQRC